MSRPTNKQDLLLAAEQGYAKLQKTIAGMSAAQLATPFDFSGQPSKKEAHWQRDKDLRDVLIHLYEWHQLLLHWVKTNLAGGSAPFLPPPYNWKTYGVMNVSFWEKHRDTPLEEAKQLLQGSHQAVLQLLEGFSNEQLFTKDVFPWVGGSVLGSYFIANTSSHYDWAIKKLRAHQKNCDVHPTN